MIYGSNYRVGDVVEVKSTRRKVEVRGGGPDQKGRIRILTRPVGHTGDATATHYAEDLTPPDNKLFG
jgi:hypothetical protein